MKDGYYTVAEIREETGLTRRQIHEYKEIIKPVNDEKIYQNARDIWYRGHGMYDSKALEKFKLVGIFLELDMKPAEIKKRIQTHDFDSYNTLREIKLLLIDKKKRLENLITAVEELEIMGIKNLGIGDLVDRNLIDMAERIKKYKNSDYVKNIINSIDKNSEELWTNLIDSYVELIEKEEEYDSQCSMDLAEAFESFISQIFVPYKPYYLLMCVFMIELDGAVPRSINEHASRDDVAEYIGNSIGMYFMEKLREDIFSTLEKYQVATKKPFEIIIDDYFDELKDVLNNYMDHPYCSDANMSDEEKKIYITDMLKEEYEENLLGLYMAVYKKGKKVDEIIEENYEKFEKLFCKCYCKVSKEMIIKKVYQYLKKYRIRKR